MDNQQDLKQPVTKEYLGDYTEKVLFPGMSSLMDDKFEAFEEKIDDKFSVFEEKMDDKFANLKGDLVVLMRKEDRKLLALVAILQNRKIISDEDAKAILALEPFPKR